ncbi:MAG: TAXI family TRAP transporter solute-binding subunit [Hyphomicrobiaceae bacterium]
MKAIRWLVLGLLPSLAAAVTILATGQLPRWLRISLVAAALVVSTGAGLYFYRYATAPTTLTLAAGSADGDTVRIISALASQLASTNAPVRLKIVDKGTMVGASQAFAAGETDLAIVRGDIGDPANSRTIVLITHGIAMLIVPQGDTIDSMEALRGKTVGVVGGVANHKLVEVLTREYDLAHKVQFVDLLPADAAAAVQGKKVQVLLVVIPLAARYLNAVRGMLPGGAKNRPTLIPIDSAGAIAEQSKSYESFDLPKGTLRGAPPVPDDDLTTLRVPIYLIARKTLNEDTATDLAKAIIEARRPLIGEYPVMAQIGAPADDKDAYMPIHPGAAAYFSGDQKTLIDKYGDQFYYGSMLLGAVMSVLAAMWKFMGIGAMPEKRPLYRLYAFNDAIRKAQSGEELADIERSIDDILQIELEKYAEGEAEPGEVAALSLATHRLEYLIGLRRLALVGSNTPHGRLAMQPETGSAT